MSNTKQLSMFEPQFDSRIRRIAVDGIIYFSVLDVFEHFGKSSNPTMAWKTVQKRLTKQGVELSKEILDRILAGGRRATPFATFKTMLRIAQVTDFKEWEHIRQWMAEVANERIEEAANPDLILPHAMQRQIDAWKAQGKDDAWIKRRLLGKKSRNVMTAAAQATHVTNTPQYAILTSREYKELLGMTKVEIVNALNLSDKEADTFRDHLNQLALQALESAEMGAGMWMESLGRPLTDDEQIEIVIQSARDLAPGFHALAGRIGIKLATGQRLLPPGQKS